MHTNCVLMYINPRTLVMDLYKRGAWENPSGYNNHSTGSYCRSFSAAGKTWGRPCAIWETRGGAMRASMGEVLSLLQGLSLSLSLSLYMYIYIYIQRLYVYIYIFMCGALPPTQKRVWESGLMIHGCVLCVVYCVLRAVCPVCVCSVFCVPRFVWEYGDL